ncbi:MAG: TMEM143 family protein [Akkermansiaceae bacterium]|jgi:hypothetical protein
MKLALSMEDIEKRSPEPEAFIPYLYDDLVEMCLEEDRLPQSQHQDFREFGSFLAAVGNFLSHQAMGSLDKDYAYFNPDSELTLRDCSKEELGKAQQRVIGAFQTAAENANYRKLSNDEIEKSFRESGLFSLNTDVDLDEFGYVECYVRGSDVTTASKRNWKLKKYEEPLEIWRRVLLLMEFKGDSELTEEQLTRRKKAALPYVQGKVYVYLYKDVPKPDLEILFPNVRVSMNIKDRFLIGVPAIAVGIGTIAKIGLKIGLVIGVIAFTVFGIKMFGVDEHQTNDIMKLVTTFLTVLVAIGVFGFKQYNVVKNKRIGFLKEVSEHLFFRNLAMNKAVFDRVIDDGEDEDAKEAMLVYYHMLVSPGKKMTRQSLDETIQDWMKEKHGTVIDFDIDGPIDKLKKFEGVTNDGIRKSLIVENADGILSIPTLYEAREIMDFHWDNAFPYSDIKEADLPS